MKKLIYLCATFLLIMSCEQDRIQEEDDFKNENATRNLTNSCTIINSNPFVGNNIATFNLSCEFYPSNVCFNEKLEDYVTTEIIDQFVQPSPRVGSSVHIQYGNQTITMSDYIDTSNIYPFFTAIKANVLYEEIACRIIEEINVLPSLTGRWYYKINVINSRSDFSLCCGPTTGIVEFIYEIVKFKN